MLPEGTAPSATALRRALRRAGDGVALDEVEAEVLLHARGEDLDRLLAAAGAVRDAGLASAGRPRTVTYSRKVFAPLTRLCRDRCGYCTFVRTPGQLRRAGEAPFLTVDEVVRLARQGAALGCKEVLFTLGDRPEDRWPEAEAWLAEAGYPSTLGYLRACAVSVLESTGLLPHLNPGVMSWEELGRLKPVAPSMGLMLETSSRRLFTTRGLAHHGSPDKDPELRLRTIADAGRHAVPFTTGILVGIGEDRSDRIALVLATLLSVCILTGGLLYMYVWGRLTVEIIPLDRQQYTVRFVNTYGEPIALQVPYDGTGLPDETPVLYGVSVALTDTARNEQAHESANVSWFYKDQPADLYGPILVPPVSSVELTLHIPPGEIPDGGASLRLVVYKAPHRRYAVKAITIPEDN